MAKQPINLQPDKIPFAEGAPADDLQTESFGEDEVLIGDPMLDNIQEQPTEFDANLAETIDQKELDRKADTLVSYYDADKNARSE